MGKTDGVLDIIGAHFDQRPAPMMYVGPSKDFLQGEIEPRVVEMIASARGLRERAATGKRMTKFRKVIGGVPLRLAWAGSATSLAAMAAKIRLVDELDRMVADVKGEGDPLTLVEARGFTYADSKLGVISTPLNGLADTSKDEVSGLEFWKKMSAEDIDSPIWRLFQSGTMYHWCWPCPCCSEYFVPRFKQLRLTADRKDADNVTAARARREAFLECPRCGGVIESHHKAEMNRRGRYVAPGQSVSPDGVVHGAPPEATALTFWVSGLASPFQSFGQRAASYVTAKLSGSQEKLQGVMNTGFGELFMPGGGDVPEWQQVADKRQPYRRFRPDRDYELPPGVKRITCGVDVQKSRLIYTIRGWGALATSWLLDADELIGLTTDDAVWDELATVITTPIGGMPIHRTLLDSGFRPGRPDAVPVNKVYEFCRRFPRFVMPSKGRATQDKPIRVSRIETTVDGTAKPYGLDLVLLDTDHWKSTVHERVKWPLGAHGAWMLPEDATDDYCKQIVSEARVKTPSGTPTWVQRSRENHFLDCEAMAAAAAWMLNVHRIRPEAKPVESEPDVKPVPSMPVAASRPVMPAQPAMAASLQRRPRLSAADVARRFR